MSYHVIFSEYSLESFAGIKIQINNRWGHAVVVEFEQITGKVIQN